MTSSVPTPMYTSVLLVVSGRSQTSHQTASKAIATTATTVQTASATPPRSTNGVRVARPRATTFSVLPAGADGASVRPTFSECVSSAMAIRVPVGGIAKRRKAP